MQVGTKSAISSQRFEPTYSGVEQTITTSLLGQPIDFTTGTTPQRIGIADIDGDGKPDAVTPNFSSNTISVLRNTATSGDINGSSFAAKADFAAGSQPSSLAIADFDGDGKRDIAVAHTGAGNVAVYRNTSTSGSISLDAKVDFTGGDGQLAVGDFDLDGKIDIAVRHSTNDDISVLHNTATSGSITAGSFAPKVDFTTGDNPITVGIGDIDGDGKPELVLPNRTSTTLAVHRNTTVGGVIDASSFAPKVDFTATAGCQKVLLTDVDGDGKLDAAVTNDSGTLSLFRNTATSGTINGSSLATRVDFTTGGDPLDMAGGDFDGDGKTDLATVNNVVNTASLFKNTSSTGVINSGSLAAKVDFATGDTPPGIGIADFDGDGKLDLAVNSQTPNTFSVYHNLSDRPTISSISPVSGKVGDSVTITGTNFSTTPANNVVWFGGAEATVSSSSATSLTVTVPGGAEFERVSVTVNNRTAVSDEYFLPTFDGEFPTIDASSLAAKVDFTTGTNPFDVHLADLDGDGKAEMLVPNSGDNTVSLFRNTGSSGTISFAGKVDLTANNGVQNMNVGDLDGDGELDFAVANWMSNAVSVFRNTSTVGSLSFAPRDDFNTDLAPESVGIDDFDGDGKLDLATGNNNAGANSVSVFRNTSTAGVIDASSFAAKVDFTVGVGSSGMEFGDIDGDGKLDMAASTQGGSKITLFRNLSTPGTVSFAVGFDLGVSKPLLMSFGDLDGDGKLDLASAERTGFHKLGVYRNTATSGVIDANSFAPVVEFTPGTDPFGVAIGDLDGDGKPDVAVANLASNNVSVFRNLTLTIPAPTVTSISPVSGKVGDSVTITGTNFSTTPANNVVWFGGAEATVTSASATSFTAAVPVGAEFERVSVTVNNRTAVSDEYFLPTFDGEFPTIDASSLAAKVDFTTGTNPFDVHLADLDGDGKAEMLVPNSGDNTVSLFRNTGSSGTISFAGKVDLTANNGVQNMNVGDLDGDGELDFAVANWMSNAVSVFRNTSTVGSLSFAPRDDFNTDLAPESVGIDDFDGDGKLDLATGNNNAGANSVSVLRNTGTLGSMSFATKVDFAAVNQPYEVAVGDLDGDGKPDMAVANQSSNDVSVFRNTSTAGVIDASSFAAKVDFTVGVGSSGMEFGDIDGDGKLDMAASTQGGSKITLFRNLSTPGTVSFAVGFDLGASKPLLMSFGDLDGDGKLDLASAERTGFHKLGVYRNTATSGVIDANSFAPVVEFTPGTDPFGVAIGDLDGDGKPDVAVANLASNNVSVFRNLTLTIPAPTVTSISPVSGKVGDSVTITGTNFSTTPANNVVWFGGAEATVTSASATSFTAAVPVGAELAPIAVTVNSRTAVSDEYFLPTFSSTVPGIDGATLASKEDLTTNSQPFNAALGDLDGDAKPDLVVGYLGSATVSVFRNISTSGTLNSSSFAAKIDLTAATGPLEPFVALGDLDGDGELDLLVSNFTPNTVSVFHNTSTLGSISFAAKVDISSGAGPRGIDVDDLDRDGKLDIAIARGSPSNVVSVLRNTSVQGTIGSTSFAANVDFTSDASPSDVAIGDIDGDDEPDLVVSNESASTITAYRNTSTAASPVFAAKVSFATGVSPTNLGMGDIDGDGKLDVTAANRNVTANSISVFRNTSTPGTIDGSTFAAKIDFTSGLTPFEVVLGDVDGDGKTDMLSTNLGADDMSLFRNTATSGTIDANTFALVFKFTTGTDPYGAVIGDIDGDGKPDIGVANKGSSTLSLFHNLTTTVPLPTISTFSPIVGRVGKTVTVTGTNFDATAANNSVYFGDAKAEVASATSTSLTVDVPIGTTLGPVAVQRGNRTAESTGFFLPTFASSTSSIDVSTLAPKVDFPTASTPWFVAAGDLDGDGKPDLVATNNGSNTISVYHNTSVTGSITSSSFASKVDFATDTAPQGVAIRDFDGDGKPDIAVTNQTTSDVSVFRNTASSGTINGSSFAAKVDFTTGGTPAGIAIGDLDGDGKPDIATANQGNSASILRNSTTSGVIGTSSFAPKVDVTAGTSPQDVEIGDIDGDGNPDLAVTNNIAGSLSLFRNTSTIGTIDANSFAAKIDFATGSSPNVLAIGDLDGDGKLDLATPNFVSSTVSVFRNTAASGVINGSSLATKVDYVTGTQPIGVAFADMNGDSKVDMTVSNTVADNMSLYRNTSSSGTIDANSFALKVDFTTGDAPNDVILVDLDGDGKPDPTVVNFNSNSVSIYRSQFVSPTTGHVGTTTVGAGSEIQLFSIGLTSFGTFTLTSIDLTISDLDAPTGLISNDLDLVLYRSSDETFDSGDTQIGLQSTIDIGSTTTISPTATETPTGHTFYIITARMNTVVGEEGHAFKVGFDLNGVTTSAGTEGAAITASESNTVTFEVVADHWEFTSQPTNTTHLELFSPQPFLEARDQHGNRDKDFNGTLTLALSPAGTLSQSDFTAADGRVVIDSLTVSGAGDGRTLTATGLGLTGTSNSFDVAKADATVTLNNLDAKSDGNPKVGGATTDPPGLAVVFTHNDFGVPLASPPIDPGSYGVTATVNDPNYQGSATGTLTIFLAEPPRAVFSASTLQGNPPLTVTFTDQSTGPIETWFLEPKADDNRVYEDRNQDVRVTYSTPGTHTVFLTVRGVGITHQSSVDIIVNGPPDLVNIADATANEDESLELDLSGIDAEGGTWTLAGADQTLISASSIQGNKIEFTPVPHANGSDPVTITRTNIHSLSTSQDVTLTWAPVDDAPTIVDIGLRYTAAEDNPIHVGATANVTDLDSDVATLLWSASGFDGVLVGSTTPSNNGVDLAPVLNAFGETEATIVVTDPATGATATQEVTLVWTRVNDQPSPPVVGFPADGMTDTPLAPLFSWSARDVDFDPLVFDLFLGPTGSTLEQVASRQDAASYSSSELSPGTSYTWKVVVQDPSGATSEASFTFTTEADLRAPLVANVRSAPTEALVAFNWDTDEPATSRVQLTAEDGGPATSVANPAQLDPSTVEILRSDLVREHQLTADNLRPGTWYRYEIRSTDKHDNQSAAFLGRVLTLSAPDDTAPLFLVDPYVEGITADRATLRWRTDEPADSRVRFTRLAAAKTAVISQESASEIILDELTEDHIVELAALEAGVEYSFEAQSADASGNLSPARSGSFTTGIEADETAPEFTAGPAATAITNGSAFIALEADELVTVQIRFDTDEEISDGQLVGGTQTQSEHQIQLLGLEPSTRYFFQVLMRDASGNETRSSVRDFETRAAPDEISAEILAGPAVEALTDQSAVLVLTADEPVRVQLLLSTDPNLDGAVLEESGELQMSHTLQLTNLAANTDYFYEVLVRDGANNRSPVAPGSFQTLSQGENLPPEIVELFAEGVGFDRAAVIWRTSEPTTGSLRFEVEATAAATGAGGLITIVEPARHHREQLTQLVPRTGYRVTALALDAQGNGVERSLSLRTRGAVDVRPPLIETGPNVQGISAFSAVVEVTYNEPVELELRFAANADLNDAAALPSVERKRTHRIDLTGLDPGTTYWVGLQARDQEGNSDDELVITFTTDTEPDQTPPAFVTSPFATDLSSTFARVRLELDEPASVELVASRSEDLSSRTHARRSLERRQRHALELTNLRPDTPYFFRVTAEDADRNQTISPVNRFESLSRTQQPVQLTAGPVAQRIGDRSATVFFRLDRAAEAVVTYSPVDQPEDEVSENRGLATDHNVVLFDLAPGTEYAYTVGFGADGEATGSFRTETLAATKPPRFFGPPVVVDRKHDRVRIEWDTDEVADSEILFNPVGAANAKVLANGFDRFAAAKILAENGGERVIVPADVKNHEVVLTNLTPGTRFLFQSFCTNPAGNRVEWTVLDFLTPAGPDIAPPVMIGRPIVKGLTQSSFLVAFSTNEPTTATLRSADGVLHLASGNQETNHELRAVGLGPQTTYELTVCATDASGNGPTCSQLAVTTRAAGDRRAPRINTGPIVIAAGAEEAVVELTTDEPTAVAVSYLSIGGGATGAVERTVQDPEFRTFHRVVLSGLEPGASYGYTATVTDVAGNESASAAAEFTTAEENDGTAPTITSGPSFQGITETGVTIVWTTDEPASSLVDWSIDAASAKIAAAKVAAAQEAATAMATKQIIETVGRVERGELVQQHRLTLADLLPGTTYHIVVASKDLSSNSVTTDPGGTELFSRDHQFTTRGSRDREPPTFAVNPTVTWTNSTAVVAWGTNERAASRIDWRGGGERNSWKTMRS